MQKRSEIAIIITIILFLSGCSVRKKSITEATVNKANYSIYEVCEDIKKSNLYSDGFVIKKGKAKTSGLKINGTYAFNGKFRSNGDFMISVRGPLSIEIVRIFSVKDKVYMINRLQRVIYTGSKSAFLSSYNIPGDFIYLLFGDMPEGLNVEKNRPGEKNSIIVENYVDPFTQEITLGRDERKIEKVVIRSDNDDDIFIAEYGDFRLAEGKKYPYEIKISQEPKDIEIRIYLDEIITDFSEEIIVSLPDFRKIPL